MSPSNLKAKVGQNSILSILGKDGRDQSAYICTCPVKAAWQIRTLKWNYFVLHQLNRSCPLPVIGHGTTYLCTSWIACNTLTHAVLVLCTLTKFSTMLWALCIIAAGVRDQTRHIACTEEHTQRCRCAWNISTLKTECRMPRAVDTFECPGFVLQGIAFNFCSSKSVFLRLHLSMMGGWQPVCASDQCSIDEKAKWHGRKKRWRETTPMQWQRMEVLCDSVREGREGFLAAGQSMSCQSPWVSKKRMGLGLCMTVTGKDDESLSLISFEGCFVISLALKLDSGSGSHRWYS